MRHISVSFMIFISPHPQGVLYLGVTKSASHHQGCIGMCWPVTTSSCCIFTASLRPWPNAAFQTTHQQLHTTSRKHQENSVLFGKVLQPHDVLNIVRFTSMLSHPLHHAKFCDMSSTTRLKLWHAWRLCPASRRVAAKVGACVQRNLEGFKPWAPPHTQEQ